MIIREAKIEDKEILEKIAKKHNINLPNDGIMIVVEGDNKEILGFSNIRLVLMIEPFVANNPFVAKNLWGYIKTKTQFAGYKILRCFAQAKHKNLYKKLGFYEIFENYTPMEINFYK